MSVTCGGKEFQVAGPSWQRSAKVAHNVHLYDDVIINS